MKNSVGKREERFVQFPAYYEKSTNHSVLKINNNGMRSKVYIVSLINIALTSNGIYCLFSAKPKVHLNFILF